MSFLLGLLLAPLGWLAWLVQFNSIRPTHPAPPSSVKGVLLLSRGSLDGAGQCRWPALGIYSGVVACPAAGVPTRTAFCSQIAGEAIDHCMPLTRTTVEVFRPPLLLALWPRLASCQRPVTPCAAGQVLACRSTRSRRAWAASRADPDIVTMGFQHGTCLPSLQGPCLDIVRTHLVAG